VATAFMYTPKIKIISPEEYAEVHWPKLASIVDQILHKPSQQFSSLDFYGEVYHLCCQRHGPALYSDLLKLLQQHLYNLTSILENTPRQNFLSVFLTHFNHFYDAIGILDAIFKYLDKTYIVDKLRKTLVSVLEHLLVKDFLRRSNTLEKLKDVLHNIPPDIDPAQIMQLIKSLYSLDKDFAQLNVKLFSIYVPCLRPARDLDRDREETNNYIVELKAKGYGNTPTNPHKRKISEN